MSYNSIKLKQADMKTASDVSNKLQQNPSSIERCFDTQTSLCYSEKSELSSLSGKSDKEIVAAIINKDPLITRLYLYEKCYPLFKARYDKYYTDCETWVTSKAWTGKSLVNMYKKNFKSLALLRCVLNAFVFALKLSTKVLVEH